MTTFASSIRTQFRSIDGVSIRFAESEPGEQDALLLCPWPESLFAYAQVWTRLADNAHVVAIDLPGFGHSERRNDLLSPRAMGEFVVRVADAFGLDQPHAVGPDVGTAALLFAAASHPARFRSMVVGTGATSYPLELGEPLNSWVFSPDLDAYRRIDPRQFVTTAIGTIAATYAMPDAIREDYLTAYLGDRFVESMRYVRAYPAELPVLGELLPRIETPVQIISGSHDRVIPPSNSRFLHERLPHSKLDILEAGHFVWEEQPDAYASLLTSWWSGGYSQPA
jgi:pimeloyl-ACP methyl ester carboxylesterase